MRNSIDTAEYTSPGGRHVEVDVLKHDADAVDLALISAYKLSRIHCTRLDVAIGDVDRLDFGRG